MACDLWRRSRACDSIGGRGGGAHLRQTVGDEAEHGRGTSFGMKLSRSLGVGGRIGKTSRLQEAWKLHSDVRRGCGVASASDDDVPLVSQPHATWPQSFVWDDDHGLRHRMPAIGKSAYSCTGTERIN